MLITSLTSLTETSYMHRYIGHCRFCEHLDVLVYWGHKLMLLAGCAHIVLMSVFFHRKWCLDTESYHRDQISECEKHPPTSPSGKSDQRTRLPWANEYTRRFPQRTSWSSRSNSTTKRNRGFSQISTCTQIYSRREPRSQGYYFSPRIKTSWYGTSLSAH